MAVVGERGFWWKWYHHGGGYSSGPTETIEHNVIPGDFSVHVGISRVQPTTRGPFGAVIGIMQFGPQDFGANPEDWPPVAYGTVGSWTIASQVTKGDMTVWEFFQIWS